MQLDENAATDSYDANGNKVYESDPNGDITTYGYSDNRLTSETVKKGSNTLYSVAYTLNADGTRASANETELQPGSANATINTTWTYNALDWLMSETVVSSISGQSFSDAYTYDLDGNRTKETQTSGGTTQTTTYLYNGDDQLTSSTQGSTTTSYTYDNNGSLTKVEVGSTVTATYTYDVRNRMVGATVNGITSSDVYDDNADRVEEIVNGTATYYLIDANNPTGYTQVLQSASSPTAAPSMTYILGDRVIGQATSGGTVSYLVADGQGSTRLLVSSSGVVTATFNYDPAGNLLGVTYTPSSPPPTMYLFDGEPYDVALGQYRMGVRIYDPPVGGFDSLDPLVSSGSSSRWENGYIFADDNFPNMDDPTGLVSMYDGVLIHHAIEQMYRDDFPGNRIVIEKPIPGSSGLLWPDIADYTLGQVGEIKPLTPYGVTSGPIQLTAYLSYLNGINFTYRRRQWINIQPTPNDTGGAWYPSTWDVGVQYVPVPGVADYVFTLGNEDGVIYYETLSNVVFSLAQALAQARKDAEAYSLQTAPVLATAGAGAAIVAQQQDLFNFSFTLNQSVAAQVKLGLEYGAATGAILGAMLGIATLDSIMGAP